MKDDLKTLSDEQKITLLDFFYKSVKNGEKIEVESEERFTFRINDIRYSISMSLFDKNKILVFRATNSKSGRDLSISADDKVLDPVKIQFITDYVINARTNSGIGTNFSDDEFSEITGLEPNLLMERNKKITHIIEKIEEKVEPTKIITDEPKRKGFFNRWRNN